jgi:hypothetical protein
VALRKELHGLAKKRRTVTVSSAAYEIRTRTYDHFGNGRSRSASAGCDHPSRPVRDRVTRRQRLGCGRA